MKNRMKKLIFGTIVFVLTVYSVTFAAPYGLEYGRFLDGDWDVTGLPAQTETKVIGPVLRSEVNNLFQKNRFHQRSFIDAQQGLHLYLQDDSDIEITFIKSSDKSQHAVGVLVYRVDELGHYVITQSNIVLPRVTQDFPTEGTTALLESVPAGSNVALFLVKNGWNDSTSQVHLDREVLYTSSELNYRSDDIFWDDALRSVMVGSTSMQEVIIGFETQTDQANLCGPTYAEYEQKDYSDVVLALSFTDTPLLIEQSGVTVNQQDRDGDTVMDHLDAFPDDPEEAFETFYPSRTGYNFLVYEDRFPNVGDGDFNDFIMAINHSTVTNVEGKAVRVTARYKPIARGAGIDHQYKVAVNMPVSGELVLKKYYSNGVEIETERIELTSGRNDVMIFQSTMEALYDFDILRTGGFANTAHHQYEQIRGVTADWDIIFDEPVEQTLLDTAPYDPYIVPIDYSYDIHLPGKPYAPGSLNPTGYENFIDDNGYPWAMLVPVDWRYPLEQVLIDEVYPRFTQWRESFGTQAQDWYMDEPEPGHRAFEEKYYLDFDDETAEEG